jgi:hypothetical protein
MRQTALTQPSRFLAPLPDDYADPPRESVTRMIASSARVPRETLDDEASAWAFEEVTSTRMRTVIPTGEPPAMPSSTALTTAMSLVPFLQCPPRAVDHHTIEHDEACILALVDGRATVEQILDASTLKASTVLGILRELLESGVLGLVD